jgi:DHA1 family multidrug resistance protein-like MFS transporter
LKQEAVEPGKIPYSQISLICFNIIFVMSGLGIVSPILPLIQEWQSLSYIEIGVFVSSFGVARLVMDLPAGMAVDRWGIKVVTVTGIILSAMGSLFSALAPEYYSLLAGRVVTGLGSSLATASLQAELMLLSDHTNRSRIMSYYLLSRRTGSSVFPFIGGLLAVFTGWRSVFVFCVVVNTIGLLIALYTYRGNSRVVYQKEEATKTGPGKKEETKPKSFSFFSLHLLIIYLLSFVYFLNRNGLERTVIPMFGDFLNLSPLQIGFTLSLSTLLSLGSIYLGGMAADRWGRKLILVLGTICLLIANVLFPLVTNYFSYVVIGLLFGLAGFNTGLPNIMIIDMVDRRMTGRALGVIRFFNDLGVVLGPVVLSALMDLYGFGSAFYFNVGLLAVLLFLIIKYLPETGVGKSPAQNF